MLMQENKVKNYCEGFTLIELMIALVILTILTSFAIPEVIDHIKLVKVRTQEANLKEIRQAIDKYYGDRGRYPKTLKDLTTTTHPYFSEIPSDPFSQTADWEVAEKSNKSRWYRTASINYSGAPSQWNPEAESSVYHVRPRPVSN